MLGIGLPQSLLEVVELVDRAISLIMELIFEFGRPYDISNGATDQDNRYYPPDERCKGGRCRRRAGSSGIDRNETGHGPTLTQARDFSFSRAEI